MGNGESQHGLELMDCQSITQQSSPKHERPTLQCSSKERSSGISNPAAAVRLCRARMVYKRTNPKSMDSDDDDDVSSGTATSHAKLVKSLSKDLCCTMAVAAPGDRCATMASIPMAAIQASSGNKRDLNIVAKRGMILICDNNVHRGSLANFFPSSVAVDEDEAVTYATFGSCPPEVTDRGLTDVPGYTVSRGGDGTASSPRYI